MAEQVSERIRIDAPPTRCYEVAIDYERYPDWAKDVKQATVLERDAEGRGSKVEYRAAAFGRSARYVLQYDYSAAPAAFSWTLVEARDHGELLGLDHACTRPVEQRSQVLAHLAPRLLQPGAGVELLSEQRPPSERGDRRGLVAERSVVERVGERVRGVGRADEGAQPRFGGPERGRGGDGGLPDAALASEQQDAHLGRLDFLLQLLERCAHDHARRTPLQEAR